MHRSITRPPSTSADLSLFQYGLFLAFFLPSFPEHFLKVHCVLATPFHIHASPRSRSLSFPARPLFLTKISIPALPRYAHLGVYDPLFPSPFFLELVIPDIHPLWPAGIAPHWIIPLRLADDSARFNPWWDFLSFFFDALTPFP